MDSTSITRPSESSAHRPLLRKSGQCRFHRKGFRRGQPWACVILAFSLLVAGCDDSPPPPKSVDTVVHVSVRDASWHESAVLQLTNNTGRKLSGVRVQLINLESRQETVLQVDIEPHGQKELGYLEGWAMLPGEIVMIRYADYAMASYELFQSSAGYAGIRRTRLDKELEPDERSLGDWIFLIVVGLIFCVGVVTALEWLSNRFSKDKRRA